MFYSSRLYRVEHEIADMKMLGEEDNSSASNLPVIIDIDDRIHHFIFHVFECGLRDNPDKELIAAVDEDNKEIDKYYDADFARMTE